MSDDHLTGADFRAIVSAQLINGGLMCLAVASVVNPANAAAMAASLTVILTGVALQFGRRLSFKGFDFWLGKGTRQERTESERPSDTD